MDIFKRNLHYDFLFDPNEIMSSTNKENEKLEARRKKSHHGECWRIPVTDVGEKLI